MQASKKNQRYLWINNIVYTLLLLLVMALLAWLSVKYVAQTDWSYAQRNSLHPSSRALLQQFAGSVQVTAYVANNAALQQSIQKLIKRYQYYKPDLQLNFVNPELNPTMAREQGISRMGELIIAYAGREQRLQQLSEQALSQALQRLLRAEQRWLVFLSGHGERDPFGDANHDLSMFTQRLTAQGLQVQDINLIEQLTIPDNTDVLVIASPRLAYLAGELQRLQAYIEQGGNLLWLLEPGESQYGLEPLAEQLGLRILPGVIVDASTEALGIAQPDFAIVSEYPDTPITQDLVQITLFPQAAGLDYVGTSPWQAQPLLQTLARSWTETSELTGQIQFDANTAERAGPISLGWLLTRSLEQGEQRIAVIGDGDFLANSYLGNGGNLELGLNLINWLSQDDNMLNIVPISAPDNELQLSDPQLAMIGVLFLIGLPLLLIITGLVIWIKRRRR